MSVYLVLLSRDQHERRTRVRGLLNELHTRAKTRELSADQIL